MTTRDFVDKVALVTGTTGIGRAAAIRLASGGARVVACGIDETANAALDAAAAEQGLGLMARRTNVAEETEVEAAVADCVARYGGLDIIVNAAAVHPYGTVLTTDMATWARCIVPLPPRACSA